MQIWQQYISIIFQGVPPVVLPQASNWVSIVVVFVIGLPSTIAAIGGIMALLQTRRNAEVAANTAALVASNDKKTDTVIEKATEIHTLTNSNLSKVQAQLEVANAKIEGFNKAQEESARKIANMEILITSLVPPKGQPSPSQVNGAKLDALTTQVNNIQQGTPPIPVHDEAVLEKLSVIADKTDKKIDTLQESADVAAEQTKGKRKKKTN